MMVPLREMTPPDEPRLDADEIQGNVLPGFMKPQQAFLTFRIASAPQEARAFLRTLAITTLGDVMPSRKRVRALRTLQPRGLQVGAVPDELDDVWLNVAFTARGLLRVAGTDDATLRKSLDEFTDPAFKMGLARRSGGLGDPDGSVSTWLVGGPDNEADVLLIVAGDRADSVDDKVGELIAGAGSAGLELIHTDRAARLDEEGTEHFGFKDGVSQPGVRGVLADDEPLEHRTVLPHQVPDTWLYGLPGQLLVWPGEFVFGYPGASADPLIPGRVKRPGPAWSANGSYLVYRRLGQDVATFRREIAIHAEKLRGQPGFADWDDERLAAALVGRWKSGAPLVRTPAADDPNLGRDRLANNSFGYAKAAETLEVGEDGRLGSTASSSPEAIADPIGLACPLAAHIRKVNTRATPNDMGASRASLDRRILRRGLPFGRPLPEDAADDPADGTRGLVFISYQTSIVDQFEFLTTRWMGSPINPRAPSGHDMIVGQNGQPGEHRVRRCTLFGAGLQQATVEFTKEFIRPTGGGYFFSPSISAIRDVLTKE